ncbi:MAG: sugar phosphate isomerase/epimerase family protein [Chloroflexota bacterium]
MQVGTQLYIYQQRSSVEFGQPFEEALDAIFEQVRQAGYEGVEMPLVLCGTQEGAQRIGDLLGRHDLQLPSVYSGGALHDDSASETTWAVLEQAAEAKQLGIRSLTFNPAPARDRTKSDQELRAQARRLDQLGQQVESRGLSLALHFHAPELRDGGRELWTDLDGSSAANVGLCLDVDWAWRGGIEPLEILKRYGDRVMSVHARDARAGKWAQALGDGEYDYAPIFRRLRDLGFDGWINVELAHEAGMTWNRSTADNLQRSREWLRAQLGV